LSGSRDGEPTEINIKILTYNGNTETFGYLKVDGKFMEDGRIEVEPSVDVFGVDMYYPTKENRERYNLEIFFIFLLCLDVLLELKQFVAYFWEQISSNRRKKGISGFFSHICSSLIAYWTHDLWNVLDTVTITLLFAQGTKWWWWCTTIIPTFAPKSSRWVYESLFTNARFLRLHQTVHSMMNATNSTNSSMYKDPTLDLNGNYIHTPVPFSISNVWNKTNTTIAPIGNYNMGGYEYENLFKLGWSNELDEIVEEFNNAEKIISIRAELDVLIVIIILCQVMRLLKVLDFQPKLALVTSTLLNGGWELFHFIIVFGMQTVAFSACAHVAFGSIHPKFANYGESISTCFNLFLGDTSTHDDLSQSDRAIGWYAFFLTYMLLQTFILLNILLAILVDAYIAVRSR
tara:strand:- start:40 stop:1248 length:1209 start_codon:yes stop_codon:yes gene_type:complete